MISEAWMFVAVLSPDYSASPVCWDEFQCAKLKEYNTRTSVRRTHAGLDAGCPVQPAGRTGNRRIALTSAAATGRSCVTPPLRSSAAVSRGFMSPQSWGPPANTAPTAVIRLQELD